MRFRTRAFLLCFAPFSVLLTLSFWMIHTMTQSTVRDGLRASLRENHRALARLRSKSDLRSSRFLRVAGENAALKAGLQLLLAERHSAVARNTVEDQLRELGEHMGFDLLLFSASDGTPLVGVVREGRQLMPLNPSVLSGTREGLIDLNGRAIQIASVPVDENQENIGSLSIGEDFDLSGLTTPAVLMHEGRVLESSIPGIPVREVDAALRGCAPESECEIRLRGDAWISLPMPVPSAGGRDVVRTLQNVDVATGAVKSVLGRVFAMAAGAAVLLALLISVASARSIVNPMARMVSDLRRAGRTGVLPEFTVDESSGMSHIRELRDLAESFNRAAVAVREAQNSLETAYVEFVGSLANALDARDRYTAGHSRRVSDFSCATAAALDLAPEHIERIRIGALLHDIGKIGIADTVLQKPGKLTDEEFAIVRQHPEIGRRILEGVQGFSPYLAAVELHHENWDGTGYPKGQSGEQTPIDARIIHVSDAYDAMTSDRPYRRGMSHEQAIQILRANAGTQFDPRIVGAFAQIPAEKPAAKSALAEAV
ncbi:MAG TPA: HD-GYP domain-containing protein [Bryobacteraceae bacterium]|nr:HD-GYP domain-containing protein [Bryobacteraceae bacterium]